ncbi:RHS repeat-associated core domain-containing protein [Saccharothrix lopnurensis]|uniref:RHS repeat-associated core domain-containing protein n=1 Tax=Saccharothrix lopnurensis TaxID=1670621 RepID=A0ABW1NZC1_9PSEU
MRRSFLRGFALRAFGSTVMAVALAAGVVTGVAQAQPAAGDVVRAPRTWTPPAEVNRTPTGGLPPEVPAARAQGEVGTRTVQCSSSGDRPGALPSYPMERHRISDRLELAVNLNNGNLLVIARDLTLKGTGMNLSIDHVYNSNDWGTNGFDNWQLNTGRGVYLSLWDSGSVEMHGPNGYCVLFSPNPDGGYKRVPGLNAALTKGSDGTFTLVFDSSREKWRFNADGWLLSQSDRNGNTNTMAYTADGNTASITDSQGRVTTFGHNSYRISSITDPAGLTFGNFTYTGDKLTSYTDRDGKVVSLTYHGTTRLKSITDPRGGTYTIGYTDDYRVSSLTKPLAGGTTATTTYAYDRPNRKTTVTDANGNPAVHEFDDKGRQIKATDALGHEQSRTWTANSDVNTTTDSLSHSTTYSYDPLNNLIGTQLPTGAKNVVGYTSSAHPHLPTQVTDASGNQATREYDTRGNLTRTRSTGLNADIETYTHDNRGLVTTRKDGKGATTTYTYDTAGNLTKAAPPAPAGATTYTYDSLSRITSVTDGNGVKIDYGYDRLDRVVSAEHGATVVQANDFDANGNLTSTRVPGVTRTLTYDPRNQLTKVTRGTEVVSYTYDEVGNLKTLTTPTGTATYAYDVADRLTSLADAYSGTTTFGYDNADRRTTTNFPGGAVQTTGYDNAGRHTSITVTKPGAELLKATYRHTRPDGSDTDKLQSKTIKGVTTDYTYDGLGRLTRAGTGSYTLDNAANLLSGEGRTYTVNAADQYTGSNETTVAFDGAGNYESTTNPDSAVTHSPTNQLLTGNLGTTEVLDLHYDTSDQTQPRTVTETLTSGTTTTHVFTRTALGVTETVDNGTRSSYTRDTEGLLVGLKDRAGSRYGAITDHQGSVLALVDTNGNLAAEYRYTPYGAVTATGTAAASNPFRYLGAYQLQRGHYLLGYRVYEPSYARFFSPDPTGQEPNPYNYAGGDPINNSDPTGGSFSSSGGATIGGGVGGLAATAFVTAACGTGVGCLPAFALMGGFLGGAGAAIGSQVAGGTRSDVSTDGFWGVVGGAAFTSLGAGLGRLVKPAQQ